MIGASFGGFLRNAVKPLSPHRFAEVPKRGSFPENLGNAVQKAINTVLS